MNNIIFKTLLLKGEAGNNIASIEKTATSGAIDTYTITLTDGSTTSFQVTNGSDIESVEKTSTHGLVDTYTITLTNGDTTTFEVTNGKDSINSSAYGTSIVIYVDAENGSDNNDGLTLESALATFDEAIEMYHTSMYAQISIYLCGDSNYTCAHRIIENGAPHIYAYNGNPTLTFTATGGTGARMYTARVHLEGLLTGGVQSTLTINATNGGLYFENVALYAKNVSFKVPIMVGGNGAIFENCNFDFSDTTSDYALRLLNTSARLHNITFGISNGTTNLISGSSSIIRTWGEFNMATQPVGASNYMFYCDSCDIIITSSYSNNALSSNFLGEYYLTSSVIRQTKGHTNGYTKKIGTSTTINTIWDIGDNSSDIMDNALSATRLDVSGYVTTTGTDVIIEIPYNLAYHDTLTITELLLALRRSDGGYIGGSDRYNATSEITVLTCNTRQNLVHIEIHNASGYGAVNNTPVTGQVFITGTLS